MITVQLTELEAEKVRACLLLQAIEEERDKNNIMRSHKEAENTGEDPQEIIGKKVEFYKGLAKKFDIYSKKSKPQPLTEKELDEIEIGGWIWVIDIRMDEQRYAKKVESSRTGYYFDAAGVGYYKASHNINWIAYKNKEQAESK